jgi:hypothetical protein
MSIAGGGTRPSSGACSTPGRLLAAVPAEDDLREIRAALHGNATIVDRSVRCSGARGASSSSPEGRAAHGDVRVAVLLDLLAATYRGARRSQKEAIERLDAMDVTSSWTLCSFRPL